MAGSSEFTVGGALRRAFDILGRQGGTVLGLGAALYGLPKALLGAVLSLAGADLAPSVQEVGQQPNFALGIAVVLVVIALQAALSVLYVLSITWVANEDAMGRPAAFGAAALSALRALPAAAGTTVLVGVGVLGGLVLLIVPGIMLMLRWSVAIPALAAEPSGPLPALGRSRDLTRDHRWGILGFLAAVALANVVLALATAALPVALSGATGIAGQAATLVSDTVFAVLNGVSVAALYLELRRAGGGARPAAVST